MKAIALFYPWKYSAHLQTLICNVLELLSVSLWVHKHLINQAKVENNWKFWTREDIKILLNSIIFQCLRICNNWNNRYQECFYLHICTIILQGLCCNCMRLVAGRVNMNECPRLRLRKKWHNWSIHKKNKEGLCTKNSPLKIGLAAPHL